MEPFPDSIGEPMALFQRWLQDATESEPNDPTAAALATSTCSGVPSVRMVLTKGADNRGVRFFTSPGSQKGVELRENPMAALCFHWKSLRRQVRLQGRVDHLTFEETKAYFHSRSRGSQIAAAVSAQSQPLASRSVLDVAVQAYAAQLDGAEVPVPDTWAGFLLIPDKIEFWQDGKDRLHDRVRLVREGDAWQAQRLYP